MEWLFQELFKFTDFVLANAGRIAISMIVLFILWALLKSLLQSIVGGLGEIVGIKGRNKTKTGAKRVWVEDEVEITGTTVRIGKPATGKGILVDVEERKPRKRSRRTPAEVADEATAEAPAQPQPIMVAHPLDIKDEASRRLFEEEVEKEKEEMRRRTQG